MGTYFFDTHRAFLDLRAAGFTEAQAEALIAVVRASVFGDTSAYKDLKPARDEGASEGATPAGDSVPATED